MLGPKFLPLPIQVSTTMRSPSTATKNACTTMRNCPSSVRYGVNQSRYGSSTFGGWRRNLSHEKASSVSVTTEIVASPTFQLSDMARAYAGPHAHSRGAEMAAEPSAVTDAELVERLPRVRIDQDNRQYYGGWLQRRLLINRCNACHQWHHPPKPVCPHCWSRDLQATEVTGRGTVHLL